jgi:hypothetical protein
MIVIALCMGISGYIGLTGGAPAADLISYSPAAPLKRIVNTTIWVPNTNPSTFPNRGFAQRIG